MTAKEIVARVLNEERKHLWVWIKQERARLRDLETLTKGNYRRAIFNDPKLMRIILRYQFRGDDTKVSEAMQDWLPEDE